MPTQKWFAVQCFFVIEAGAVIPERGQTYEERITLWQAENADEAAAKASRAADSYAADNGFQRVDYVTSYEMFDAPAEGSEVWSLIRDSWLPPKEYIERFVIAGDPHAVPFVSEDDRPDRRRGSVRK
jgi:hypothetical protein